MGQFVVSFSGSLAFVPHVNGKKVRVLLPLDPHGWQPEKGTLVPPHRAFMMFRMSSLASSNERQPDFVYQEKGVQYGICILEDESITLPPSSDSLTLDKTPIVDKSHSTPDDKGSVFWIANMKDFCNMARLNTAFLATTAALAAIIDVVAGRMETESVSGDSYTVHPGSDIPGYQQCLAEGVRVSSKIADGPCEIGSNKNERLVLQDDRGQTRLEIFNEVLDDILLPKKYRREKLPNEYDFELLYKLTGLTATDADHRHVPSRLFFSGGTAACKPGIFEPQEF